MLLPRILILNHVSYQAESGMNSAVRAFCTLYGFVLLQLFAAHTCGWSVCWCAAAPLFQNSNSNQKFRNKTAERTDAYDTYGMLQQHCPRPLSHLAGRRCGRGLRDPECGKKSAAEAVPLKRSEKKRGKDGSVRCAPRRQRRQDAPLTPSPLSWNTSSLTAYSRTGTDYMVRLEPDELAKL